MKNRIDSSRRKTPWDHKDNLSELENFIKDKYIESYDFKHPSLSETTEYKILNNLKITKCKRCDSLNIRKYGKNSNMVQRYFCNDCKKVLLRLLIQYLKIIKFL